MKIGSSQISMASSRIYSQMSYSGFTYMASRSDRQFVNVASGRSKSVFEKIRDARARANSNARDAGVGNAAAGNTEEIQRISRNGDGMRTINSVDELKEVLLDRLLSSLRNRRYYRGGGMPGWENGSFLYERNFSFVPTAMHQGTVVMLPQTYRVQPVRSDFYSESETTAFVSQGVVRTEDGREIKFDVSFEMSRAFEQSNTLPVQELRQQSVMCDPLVVNFKGDTAQLGDQKFLFDLDADGKEEEIRGFSSNSGFLALDLNGDGIINDGSELFGTKSGNGFADLARYDSDGNGWIDDNDDIFAKLMVWTKDADGHDRLISAKDSGMGAIFLGNVQTEFGLTDTFDNVLMGAVRRSGIYLNEDGTAGTVQHVDFAI